MRPVILFALAFTLRAQSPVPGVDVPKPKPLATVEELTKQVAERNQQIAKLSEQLARSNQKLTVYRNETNVCRDAMLDAQIDAKSKQEKATKP